MKQYIAEGAIGLLLLTTGALGAFLVSWGNVEARVEAHVNDPLIHAPNPAILFDKVEKRLDILEDQNRKVLQALGEIQGTLRKEKR